MANSVFVRTAGLLVGMAAVLLIFAAAAAHAQESDEGPQLTFQSLQDGDVLAEPPFVVQLCFSEPIDIKSPAEGGDRSFSLTNPEGLGLGLREVVQRNGWGISVFPGDPPSLPTGHAPAVDQVWTFEWRVTAADDLTPAEGTITFTIDEDAEAIPDETLPPCAGSALTPGPAPTGLETVDDTDGVLAEDDDGDTDVLLVVLLAAGALGGLVVAGLLGYVVRKRVRNDRPRPDSGETLSPEDHQQPEGD